MFTFIKNVFSRLTHKRTPHEAIKFANDFYNSFKD